MSMDATASPQGAGSGPTEHSAGIRDWDEKLEIACRVLGAYTFKDLAEFVYPRDPEAAHQAYENFRKWRRRSPKRTDGPRQFLDALARALNCPDFVTGPMWRDDRVEACIDYLPEADRARAFEALNEYRRGHAVRQPEVPVNLTPARLSKRGARFRQMMFMQDDTVPSLRSGIQQGRIAQEHYYLYSDAAMSWHKLVRDASYALYDDCKAGLRTLVEGEIWQGAIEEAKPTGVVMLGGGGAPTKDLLLIKNLLSQPALAGKSIRYFLVDVSSYMLKASTTWLCESLQDVKGAERVEIVAHWHDMMSLKDCDDAFRTDEGALLFAITGGTFGNVNERKFFESVGSIARPNDLLIISADTIEGAPSAELQAQLTAEYDIPTVRRLFSPSIHALIGELRLKDSDEGLFDQSAPTIEDAASAGLSSVPESYAVTRRIEVDDPGKDAKRSVTLFSSTRYSEEPLKTFARQFCWSPLTVVTSPHNDRFKQFLFRFGQRPLS